MCLRFGFESGILYAIVYIQVETPQVGGREYSLKAQKITKNVFFTDLDPKHYLSRGAVGFEKDAYPHDG